MTTIIYGLNFTVSELHAPFNGKQMEENWPTRAAKKVTKIENRRKKVSGTHTKQIYASPHKQLNDFSEASTD